MNTYKNIDEYIANFPDATQEKLKKIRQIIRDTAPNAVEVISYGIPTYKLDGKNVIHFGGYEKHIGLYPGSTPIVSLQKDLEGYKTSKGTVQFPLDKPIPYDLIKKITKFCVEQRLK